MIKFILIFILISNLASAQNAVHLNRNDKAPFEGNLLTLEITKQLYNDSLEKSSLQKQLDLTNSNVTLLKQNETLLLDQNGKLIKAAQSEKTLTDLEKAGCFVLGVVVTGLAIKGMQSLR